MKVNWQNYWDDMAKNNSDKFLQVGRSCNRYNYSDNVVCSLTDYIIDTLKIENHHELLDVCCGNGLFTGDLASQCRKIYNLDFSPYQLMEARQRNHAIKNIEYIQADALKLSAGFSKKVDRILLYFSFQYFDTYAKGEEVIIQMKRVLKPGGKILIGDIPDKKRLWLYYDSLAKKFRYCKYKIWGKNVMGKFWSKNEMDTICNTNHLTGVFLPQPAHFPYSDYRFDYMIDKK